MRTVRKRLHKMPEAGRVWRVLQADSAEQHQIEIDLHSIAETVELLHRPQELPHLRR